MFRKLKNISISYKIHIPLIFISIVGLSVIIFNSFLSLQSMEKRAKEDIKHELNSYIQDEISKKFQIGLTNAINISLNKQVIDSLKHSDRNSANNILTTISENFQKYSTMKDIKIHLHDKNINSFIRSWKIDKYGDNLSAFRHSLNLVNENKKPIVEIESGRVGMLIRGIAPVFDGDVFLGTIEFMQDFNSLVETSKREKNYSILVLSHDHGNENIEKFDKDKVFISDEMLLSQKFNKTDEKFYNTLKKEFNKELVKNSELMKVGDYYVSILELKNTDEKIIGYILIGADKEYVNRYVDYVKEIFINQIWILLIVDLIMLIILIILFNIAIKHPIFKLLESIKNINKKLKNKITPLEVYKKHRLKYESHDETGIISATINALLRTMSKTFIELQKSQRHTSEYIKAIYAGGLVSTGDIYGNITYVNDEFCDITGYTREELIGKPHSIFRDKKTSKRTYEKMWNQIESGKIYNNILKNRKKDGSVFYSNTTIIPIKNEKDEIVEYIAYRNDITELIKSKEELKRTFQIDQLTNLGNRFKMLSDITEEYYLAILDVDFFREINDFYGHKIGDEVLIDLSKRLFEYFDIYNMEVYHLNGDEFAILAHKDFIEQRSFFKTIKTFLDINKNTEVTIEGNTNIVTRLTCGISYGNDNLMNYADIAHKHAKKIKKDILEYTDSISNNDEYKKNLEWTTELKKAIEEGRIKAYYQPIVNLANSKIEKYETLMRLIKEDGEEVSPIHFLDIAKKTRVYKELTEIIVNQAFDKFKDTDYEFSINLSIEDIMLHDIGSWIFDLAVEKGVNRQLVIELVESEGIESFDTINNFIQIAKEHGMKIAIDDFGTGYSNFEYLIKLNADYLKIDGSLMKGIDSDVRLYGVVETIVAFAKKNSIKVIGEFVCNEEIYEKTIELEIDFGQGYYLGKPSIDLQQS